MEGRQSHALRGRDGARQLESVQRLLDRVVCGRQRLRVGFWEQPSWETKACERQTRELAPHCYAQLVVLGERWGSSSGCARERPFPPQPHPRRSPAAREGGCDACLPTMDDETASGGRPRGTRQRQKGSWRLSSCHEAAVSIGHSLILHARQGPPLRSPVPSSLAEGASPWLRFRASAFHELWLVVAVGQDVNDSPRDAFAEAAAQSECDSAILRLRSANRVLSSRQPGSCKSRVPFRSSLRAVLCWRQKAQHRSA